MDKRTILFVLLVSVTFFGLNIYFSSVRDKEQRAYLQEQEAAAKQKQTKMEGDYQKRTAPLATLPLVSMEAEGKVVGKGIRVKEGTLTLAWTKPLPQTISVDGVEEKLLTSDYVVQGPVLYGSSKFDLFDIASLPAEGSYDVQVVTLPQETAPQVFLGEYSDEDLTFPGYTPLSNAIALVKSDDNRYLPLGFYEKQSQLFVELQKMPLFSAVVHAKAPPKVVTTGEQRYFVLENAYQQVVFSNKGGAVVEINLPFESEKNPKSVVKEIGFDREILKGSPDNARFPLHPYYSSESSAIHPEGVLGGYYPLLRRGFANKPPVGAENYAFNLVSDFPDVAQMMYEVKEFTDTKIVFEASSTLRKVTKTYELTQAPYTLELEVKIEGAAKNLWLSSGVPDVEIISNSYTPQIQYRLLRKGKSEVEKVDLPKPKEVINLSSFNPNWVVNSNGYLGVILDPLTSIAPGFRALGIAGEALPTRLTLIDPQYEPYKASKYDAYNTFLPLPSEGGTSRFRIYAGPFEESVLATLDKEFTDPTTGLSPDYTATRTFYGFFSFISEPFAKMLFVVMKFFYMLTHSWAFSIILLTVFLRVLLYPLNAWSIKSMKRMQEISPEVQAIQKKYKKEPKKAQIEIMQLYRERKVNPFMGCFPILIQLPFLIAMFDLLKSSFQLRGASFIPGWIDNLTAPDVLFSWSQPIFFIGTEFHLLPFLLGAVMFLQQKVSSTAPKDPSQMSDQQRQQRAMGTMMTILFTVMFYNFPSGLNIYWLSSMLLGILQQWGTTRLSRTPEKKLVRK